MSLFMLFFYVDMIFCGFDGGILLLLAEFKYLILLIWQQLIFKLRIFDFFFDIVSRIFVRERNGASFSVVRNGHYV